jgi:TetR/AcrR family transcriptional repressor of nem operon
VVGGDTSRSRTARRDELVEAAFRLVATTGLEGLRLRDVADAVGIDHSTLHHHVATKQELIEAIAEYTVGPLRTTMPTEGEPGSRLGGHLATLHGLMVKRPELFTVSAELDLRARRDPAVRAVMGQHEAGWRAALVEELQARGARAPTAAAELVIAAVKGVRLHPSVAGAVFAELETLLAPKIPTEERLTCPTGSE